MFRRFVELEDSHRSSPGRSPTARRALRPRRAGSARSNVVCLSCLRLSPAFTRKPGRRFSVVCHLAMRPRVPGRRPHGGEPPSRLPTEVGTQTDRLRHPTVDARSSIPYAYRHHHLTGQRGRPSLGGHDAPVRCMDMFDSGFSESGGHWTGLSAMYCVMRARDRSFRTMLSWNDFCQRNRSCPAR